MKKGLPNRLRERKGRKMKKKKGLLLGRSSKFSGSESRGKAKTIMKKPKAEEETRKRKKSGQKEKRKRKLEFWGKFGKKKPLGKYCLKGSRIGPGNRQEGGT